MTCVADTYNIFCYAVDSRVEQTLLQITQKLKEEITEDVMQRTGKRHKTGFTEAPIHLGDGEYLHLGSVGSLNNMLCTKPLTLYDSAVPLCASLHNVTRIKVCGLYGSLALPLQAICASLQHSMPNVVQRGYCGSRRCKARLHVALQTLMTCCNPLTLSWQLCGTCLCFMVGDIRMPKIFFV